MPLLSEIAGSNFAVGEKSTCMLSEDIYMVVSSIQGIVYLGRIFSRYLEYHPALVLFCEILALFLFSLLVLYSAP
jgi:hypothetical protein